MAKPVAKRVINSEIGKRVTVYLLDNSWCHVVTDYDLFEMGYEGFSKIRKRFNKICKELKNENTI